MENKCLVCLAFLNKTQYYFFGKLNNVEILSFSGIFPVIRFNGSRKFVQTYNRTSYRNQSVARGFPNKLSNHFEIFRQIEKPNEHWVTRPP